ncbi:hypothetical protein J6590_016976 [Homalodisca vitripennis]|nr:hypothetical protein J6590_016976 [Homalodisca vitripennis]
MSASRYAANGPTASSHGAGDNLVPIVLPDPTIIRSPATGTLSTCCKTPDINPTEVGGAESSGNSCITSRPRWCEGIISGNVLK